jgi:hypothetical protein
VLRSPHDRRIFALAIPALGALAAEPLYVLVDTAIVGHLGTTQLASLAIAATVMSTAFTIFNFLTYGTTAQVARLHGAKQDANAAALGARFHLRSRDGRRTLTADELFQGPLTTAIRDGELLEEIEVPPLPAGARTGFAEYARTHGDFAQAAVAVVRTPERTTIVTLGPRVVTDLHTRDHAGALIAALVAEAMPA